MNTIRLIRGLLTHRYLALILRLYIGGLFIYASMYKINYPAEFAETVASYQIIPYWAVNIFAVVLPWAELICGVLLVTGIRSRSATVIIGLMLIMFTTATFINLMRDTAISCGCFQAIGETISWRTIGRDVIWLIMTIHVFFWDKSLHLDNRFILMLREI